MRHRQTAIAGSIAVCLVVHLCLTTPAHGASEDEIVFHIVDAGINQYWTAEMQVGDSFATTPAGPDKKQHIQAYGDMHARVQDRLGDKAKSQILIPMPSDREMAIMDDAALEIYFTINLKKSVESAVADGNRDFEFQLIQNINTFGYGDRDRQLLVERFSSAAYGAIGKTVKELESNQKRVQVDAFLGSNGTVGFAAAVDKWKGFADHIRSVDLVNGRASLEPIRRGLRR